MKLRYKVLAANLALLSLAVGILGYLMIKKNFSLAYDAKLQGAIAENNLVQSSVEYALLDVINGGGYDMESELSDIGGRVAETMRQADFVFYIRYGRDYAYMGDGMSAQIPMELYAGLAQGYKDYMVCAEGDGHAAYVASCSGVDGEYLYVVTKTDVSDAYWLMARQVRYFRLVAAVVLAVAAAASFLVSRGLTKPLERLGEVTEEIAAGHYDTRADAESADEAGILALQFNKMADAVTEHIAAQEDMLRRQEQFVADFTHEIKTPMTAIIGYADTLRSMELSREEGLLSLNYIFSEGKRLEALSGKLLELLRLRHEDIEMGPVNTAELGNALGRICAPSMEKKGVGLSIDMESAVLIGSRELLESAFLNLLDNARKASAAGQEVSLVGRVDGEYYEVAVTDHGIGMTAEEASHVCDAFYMADKSRARREGGAGIGMSLAAMILERHHATLVVESVPNEGTVVRVKFTEWEKEDDFLEESEPKEDDVAREERVMR